MGINDKIMSDVIDINKTSDATNNEQKKQTAPGFLSRQRREERRGARLDMGNLDQNLISKPRRHKTIWWVLGIVIILVLVILVPLAFSSAGVKITPHTETVTIEEMSASAGNITSNQELKYNILLVDGEASVEVPASGKKIVERQASGNIEILNIGTQAIKLIAKTRFQSTSNLEYRI